MVEWSVFQENIQASVDFAILLYTDTYPIIQTFYRSRPCPLPPGVFSDAKFSRPLLMPKTFGTGAVQQRLSRWQESSFLLRPKRIPAKKFAS